MTVRAATEQGTPARDTTGGHGPGAGPAPAARQDLRLTAAWEAIERPDIKVVSTDVFDTLLWRQVAEPADAFTLLAERLRQRGRLAPHLAAGAFRQLRVLAEREARSRRALQFNDLEATLREVYDVLPGWVFKHPVDVQVAIDTEIALERELVVPDLDVAELLRAAHEAGKLVIAVSDTYFSAAELRHLLDQPGLDGVIVDRVYTSSDHRRGKAAGLFEVVLADVGVPPAAMLHLGDNEKADIEPAEKLGIPTTSFERHPRELEELLEQELRFLRPRFAGDGHPPFPVELTSLRGKVAVRAEGRRLPPTLQPFWSVGALVHGPVFTGFAEWVQERAHELGARRIHCLMREGHFLAPLVDRAGEYLGLPGRCERLWLNREVLGAATIGAGAASEFEHLLARRVTPTVEELLRTVGLSLADLPRFTSHAATRLDDPVTRHNLIEAIVEDEALRNRVVLNAAEARERIVDYVDGLLDGDDRLCLVDLGWAGSAQLMLHRVLTLAGRQVDILGLYLLTHEGSARCAFAGMQAWGFLGSYGFPEATVRAIVRTPEIIEQACMPDHGPQVGLDAELAPRLGPAAHDAIQMTQAGAVRQGIEAFQREWGRYAVVAPGKLPALAHAPEELSSLLVRQLVAPTETEATLLGSWQHDENLGSERTSEIADVALGERLRHLSPEQLRDLPMSELYWPAGLAARVDRGYAEMFAAAAAGELAWDWLSSEVESGPFVIEAQGVDVDPDSGLDEATRRNRFGLSAVSGSIMAPAVQGLVLRPSVHPCVVRLDYLDVSCHVQGQADPVVLSLRSPEDFARLRRANCFLLNANVFVVHGGGPELHLDLEPDVVGTVFRVDVRCGFCVLPISQLLPVPGRLRSVEEAGVLVEQLEEQVIGLRREVATMKGSLSWRLTRPLRLLNRGAS